MASTCCCTKSSSWPSSTSVWCGQATTSLTRVFLGAVNPGRGLFSHTGKVIFRLGHSNCLNSRCTQTWLALRRHCSLRSPSGSCCSAPASFSVSAMLSIWPYRCISLPVTLLFPGHYCEMCCLYSAQSLSE